MSEADKTHEAQAGAEPERRHFIQSEIDKDLAAGKNAGRVHTRFPPEPNGYLHVGHAKAICLVFDMAEEFGGKCNLRFDDTNPAAEDTEFVEAIQADIRWLGYEWTGGLHYTSGYFERLYELAQELIRGGHAYVDDLSLTDLREQRGDGRRPGVNSPFRERAVEENLDLFARMRAGEFKDGERTLRAKIDMASPNMNMRDPILYRILRATHHRTGDAWCIYPTYDWAHGQSDAIEAITHSLCSLEFENHRPLYDWFLDHLSLPDRPRQIEFARLELEYTMTSKRKLQALVADGTVDGWDDPRMPTLSGMRRRGYTPESLRAFCRGVGVAKFNSTIELVVLENALREDLNRRAHRRMAVLKPLEVEISNLADGERLAVQAVNNPGDEAAGTRELAITKRIYIDADDFREEAPRKFFRLKSGGEVRLRYGYVIRCDEVHKDPQTGEVVKLTCSLDRDSGEGKTSDGRKVKGIIHWVNAEDAVDGELRLYQPLFLAKHPARSEDWAADLNSDSREVVSAKLEPSLATAEPGATFQFERVGYFCADRDGVDPKRPMFHRAVSLKDTWAKIAAR